MHSLPLFGVGVFLAIGGIALFAFTLRKAPASPTPPKKSELREMAAQQTETNKLRVAAAMLVVAGVLLLTIF